MATFSNFFRNVISLLTILGLITLTACHRKEAPNTIKVGVMAGPESELMEVAKEVALKQYGLNVKIVNFTDYNMPNAALNDGSIDANMFQHLSFLAFQIKARGYKITPIDKTFVFPMGLYSKTITNLSQIKNGSKVGIPNDPSNEGRALLLLQKAGLITLSSGSGMDATVRDVSSNPHNLKIIALDAAELPRSLYDLSLAAINTNYAIPAGLFPTKDALVIEGPDSPYANLVVVRTADKNSPQFKELIEALHSKEVIEEAKKLFGADVVPAWKVNTSLRKASRKFVVNQS